MSDSSIVGIVAREILDSRGNPTVEVDVLLKSGKRGRAAAPSGASTGSREALELRDQDPHRYLGRGVQKAVANIHDKIFPAIKGMDSLQSVEIDNVMKLLDGTANKSNLGANAMLAVSLAVSKAAAEHEYVRFFHHISTATGAYFERDESDFYLLPVPMMNIINGGAHADNSVDIQEFMIQPTGAPSFSEAIRYGAEIFHALKAELKAKGLSTAVGDEGGFAPDLSSNEAAISLIMTAIEQAGFKPGVDIHLALDCAASEFYDASTQQYRLDSENKSLDANGFVDYLATLARQYPIRSIEDGLDESDWDGWRYLTDCLGERIQLVGDDLFVTNTEILQQGIDAGVANAILIKPNQIGTLSETLWAIDMAKDAGYDWVISHRSGETADTSIAHLALATRASQIKTGSLCRSDRVAKYNELLRIESELADMAKFSRLNRLGF